MVMSFFSSFRAFLPFARTGEEGSVRALFVDFLAAGGLAVEEDEDEEEEEEEKSLLSTATS